MWFDTHTHLYLEQFDNDRAQVIQRAFESGVDKMALPNIDVSTMPGLFELCEQFPNNIFPMLGLHPCSVNADFERELNQIRQRIDRSKIIAIGEIGLDFHWDLTFAKEQEKAFELQCHWAKELDLPIVIHSRKSIDRNIELLESYNLGIKGVFHCFTGTIEQAHRIIDLGFMLGIGGVATFKNSGMDEVLRQIDLNYVVLETDSPYLAPTPFRGKRNESSFIIEVAKKLATIKATELEQISTVTYNNSLKLYRLESN